MLSRVTPLIKSIWLWFRARSIFVQCLLIVPILCAIAFTVLVGNMGLALMGVAISVSGPVVGWIGGVLVVTFTKASTVIWKSKPGAE